MEPITILALGAVAYGLWKLKKAPKVVVNSQTGAATSTVTGKSGHVWVLEAQDLGGASATTVYATPDWGGNMTLPVLQYHQTGTDTSSRKATWASTEPGTPLMVSAAMADFGVKAQ